jgi:hypothetical protein
MLLFSLPPNKTVPAFCIASRYARRELLHELCVISAVVSQHGLSPERRDAESVAAFPLREDALTASRSTSRGRQGWPIPKGRQEPNSLHLLLKAVVERMIFTYKNLAALTDATFAKRSFRPYLRQQDIPDSQ